MTTPRVEYSIYRPTVFAWAVAALMTLDDTDEDQAAGIVHLSKPAGPGWRAWTRATDWRVDEGDTLFGNFEVVDDGSGHPRSCGLRRLNHRSPEGQPWVDRKAQQLDDVMRLLHGDEPPLLRWIAAVVDVLPLTDLGEGIWFRRSLVRDDIEITAQRVVIGVSRTATHWVLRLDSRLSGGPPVSQEVPANQTEHQCIYDLLFAGWIFGRKPE